MVRDDSEKKENKFRGYTLSKIKMCYGIVGTPMYTYFCVRDTLAHLHGNPGGLFQNPFFDGFLLIIAILMGISGYKRYKEIKELEKVLSQKEEGKLERII